MKYTFKANLTSESIRNMVGQITDYRQNILPQKLELLVTRLAEEGITVAIHTISPGMGKYVMFTQEVERTPDGIVGYMVATETGQIHAEWEQKDGSTRSADVSPLLMSEFGSGKFASDTPITFFDSDLKVGRGTFPEQTHAFNPKGWYYKDSKGWHHSYGYQPTKPMLTAWQAMFEKIDSLALEIFG